MAKRTSTTTSSDTRQTKMNGESSSHRHAQVHDLHTPSSRLPLVHANSIHEYLGGEFSSIHQNPFHHYRDFWCFDIPTHSWDRIDTKIRPTARSGHRMAVWKHYIILLVAFTIQASPEYKWTLVEFKDTAPRPSPRSGFSFLPCAEGVVLHGGYCKEYMKGKRPVGVMLDDTWLLNISFPSEDSPSTAKPSGSSRTKASTSKSGCVTPIFKWEKRKRPSDAYAPCQRSGCMMLLWSARNMRVLFGGVTDEDTSEEWLDSVFWNDLYGYQLTGKGKWISMSQRRQAQCEEDTAAEKGQRRRREKEVDGTDSRKGEGDTGEDSENENNESDRNGTPQQPKDKAVSVTGAGEGAVDVVDQLSTTPLPRYNAVLAVLRNTLYIYGGIYERGSREYTLDDFYALQLDKMEVYRCLKKSDVVIPEGEEESSSDDDDDDEDEDRDDSGEDTDDEDGETLVDEEQMRIVMEKDEDGNVFRLDKVVEDLAEDLDDVSLAEEETNAPDEDEQSDLRAKATAFMGVSKDTTRSAEDVQSTPLPGETLAMFYARSCEYWAQKAVENSGNRGKQLCRDGFALAEERYAAYKPMLEKILQEAGLDEEEMRRGAAGGPALPGSEGSTSWSVETWERWNAVPLSKPVKDVAQSQLMGMPNGEWVKERGCWSED
ncbi:hypothetical protein D9613_011291 [Agrocybe pediades]|uniref:DUF4110 domain-containing protein n=1 Tax=Agrocybe pediades TaxID=84607 RepID=A0A8H4QSS8_9AGAR|nr:hypothetical protein D9613_011291 [Agrocybe pediades]